MAKMTHDQKVEVIAKNFCKLMVGEWAFQRSLPVVVQLATMHLSELNE